MDSVLTGRPFNLSKLSRTNLKRMVSFLDEEDVAWYPRQKVQSARKKLEGFNPAHVMRLVIILFSLVIAHSIDPASGLNTLSGPM